MTVGTAIATEVAVIGAGSIGIAMAFYLVEHHGVRNVVLIDVRDPMSDTPSLVRLPH